LGGRRRRGRRRLSRSWRKGCRRFVAQGIIDELEFAREAPSASILTSSPSYTLSGLRNITQFRVGKISRLRRQYLSKSFMTVFHIRPSARAKYTTPRAKYPIPYYTTSP
jgi:hypothetical protein